MQYNDEIQIRNYGRNKRAIPTGYCVDAQAPRLLFFGREGPAGARTGASSNPELRIGFGVE